MKHNIEEIVPSITSAIEYTEDKIKIINISLLKEKVIDTLVWNAVFGDEQVKTLCKKLIWEIALELNIIPSSIFDLYVAIGRCEVDGFTVPAINIRGLTYDVARTIFRTARNLSAGAIILEIARSEMGYTNQPPEEYSTVILAAAIKEGYSLPIFIQGDHFQVSAKKFNTDPETELNSIKELIKKSISAGFYNIDLDTSTLVDESKPDLDEQQKNNYTVAYKLTEYVREIQPKGIEVNLGGEIGEIGTKNSTEEDLISYMDGYLKLLPSQMKGITKLAIQTGTTHGGVPLPDGTIAKVKLDFDTIDRLTKLAKKKYNLAGCVQHGASTLPAEMFHKFPKVGTLEIHLATEFQNMIFDHHLFPEELRKEIYNYLTEHAKDERKPGDTEQQFLYKTRKKSFGPFKKDIWSLDKNVREAICKNLEEKFGFLFTQLNVKNTEDVVKKYIKPVKVKPQFLPAEFKEKFEGAD